MCLVPFIQPLSLFTAYRENYSVVSDLTLKSVIDSCRTKSHVNALDGLELNTALICKWEDILFLFKFQYHQI